MVASSGRCAAAYAHCPVSQFTPPTTVPTHAVTDVVSVLRLGKMTAVCHALAASAVPRRDLQVHPRYSDFRSLNSILKEACPTFSSEFPSKQRFGNTDPKFLESRKVALSKWLDVGHG